MAITVTPSAVTISVSQAANVPSSADIVVSNTNILPITGATSNQGIARVQVKSGFGPGFGFGKVGFGPSANFSIFAIAAGSPTITFTDEIGGTATCSVTVNS
jgi:uncharacterized protein YjdB